MADQRDIHRHYWIYHKKYAEERNIPNPATTCDTCRAKFTRNDNMTRHKNKGKCQAKRT